MNNKVFSNKLKSLVIDKGVSQETLAKIFNTTQQTISRWLNGVNEPDYETLIKLADFFNCSTDYLLGKENDYGVKTFNKSNLTDTELNLVATFNLLSKDDQNKVLGFIKALETTK